MMEERIQRGGSANRAFWNRFSARCCFKHRQAPRLSAARCIIAQPAPLRGASAPAPTAPRKGHAGQGPSRSLSSRASRTPSISIGTPRYECCQLHHLVIPSCLPAHRHPEEDDPDTAASGETSSAGHEWCSAARRSRTKIQIGNKFPDSRGQRRVVIQVRLFPSGALAPRFPGLGSVTVGRPAPSLKSRVIDDAFESPKSPWFLRRAKSPGETLLFGLENIRLARDFSRFPGTRARGSTASVSDAKRSCRPADAEGQLRVLSFLHQRVAASCLLMLRPESHSPIARPERPQASSHILAIASWISE